MSLVHVYGHQNSRRLVSTLMPLAYLNVRLDILAEHIMPAYLLSSATRNTIAIGLSDLHGILSVSIHESPVHSNIDQSIGYEISRHQLLQHWDSKSLTHIADWDEINFTLFKLARETTNAYMSHFVRKCISNTLPTMTFLQR